jgi:hypothetical protein
MRQEKSSSLKRKHLALQNLNFLHFLCVILAPLDSKETDQNECGSATLLLGIMNCKRRC